MSLVSLLGLFLIYQLQPASFQLDVGTVKARSFLANIYAPETGEAGTYRWTTQESYINHYQAGTPYQLTFQASTANPNVDRVAVTIVANGHELGKVQVGHSLETFTLRTPRIEWGPGDLAFTFRVASTFPETFKNGRENLGIALYWVRVDGYPNRLGLRIPPPLQWLWWVGVVLWPLANIRLFYLKVGYWSGYALSIFNFGLISWQLLDSSTFTYLQMEWLLAGIPLALIELAGAIIWSGTGYL